MGHHSSRPGRCPKRPVTSTLPVVTILVLPDAWNPYPWSLLILKKERCSLSWDDLDDRAEPGHRPECGNRDVLWYATPSR